MKNLVSSISGINLLIFLSLACFLHVLLLSVPFLSLPSLKHTHSLCPYPIKILLFFTDATQPNACLVIEASVTKILAFYMKHEIST